MTKSQLGLLGTVLAAGALAIAGCGGGGGGGGTGGRKADGGTGGKGTGGSGAGGVTGTGGRADAGTGGMTGTGGAADSGTGGSADGGGTGGAVSDAGSDVGTGGTDAGDETGGSDAGTDTPIADTGSDSGPASPLIPICTFATGLDTCSLLFVTDSLKPEAGDQVTAEFDGTIGRPDPGSAKVAIPFAPMAGVTDEHIEFGANFTPVDMRGRIITARVMLDAVDGSASAGVQAFFVVKSATATNPNAFVYANGAFTNLNAGNWVTVIMLADGPGFMATGFDPSRIQQVAVGIQGNPANAGLTAATLHVDSIGYQ
jgi:hypothetical protein